MLVFFPVEFPISLPLQYRLLDAALLHSVRGSVRYKKVQVDCVLFGPIFSFISELVLFKPEATS